MRFFVSKALLIVSINHLFFATFSVNQHQNPDGAAAIQPRSLLVSRDDGQTAQLEQRVHARLGSSRQRSTASLPTITKVPSSTIPTTTVATTAKRAFAGKPSCQLDIVLLIDMSGGALKQRESYLAMAGELVRALDIDEFAAQIALVRYSGKGRTDTMFRLKNRYNQSTLLDELSQAQPLGGTTRTKEAMLHAQREFQQKFGGREKAERVLIVFTDGYSQDDPSEIASELRRDHIHVYAVAVEDLELKPNEDQLKVIASDPQSVIIGAAQFGALKQRLAPARCR